MLDDIVIATVSRTHRKFPQTIAETAGQREDVLSIMMPQKFSSNEFCPKYNVDVKGKRVYLIATQGPFQNPQEMSMRIALAASAAKEHDAKHVTVIATDLPFSRQDRGNKDDPKMKGQPCSAEVQAKIFYNCGVDRVLTIHLHSKKLYDIYSKVYGKDGRDVLYGLTPDFLIAHYLKFKSGLNMDPEGKDLVFVAIDKGIEQFITKVKDMMGVPGAGLMTFEKIRKTPNKSDSVSVEGIKNYNITTLENKKILILDDIWDTCGTMESFCNWLKYIYPKQSGSLGQPKEFYMYATHPVFAGNAYMEKQRVLAEIGAKEYICTNTRPYIAYENDYLFEEKATILCIEKLLGNAIINCCEKNKHPDDYYKIKSVDELQKKGDKLYSIRRSERHPLEKE